MARKRLLWQLFPSFLFIVFIALLAVTWYSSRTLHAFYLEQIERTLHDRAIILRETFAAPDIWSKPVEANAIARRLGNQTETRITLIRPDGTVIADSREDPTVMDNHAARPEVRSAMNDSLGMSLRFSQTLQSELMYVAIPLRTNGELIGIVRTAQTTSAIGRIIGEIQGQIIIAGIIVALLAAVLSLWMSRRITRPLTDLREGAELFAHGDFSHRLPTSQSEEIAALSESMNFMAAQLDERMRTVIRQRNEIEAILASMVEGVIAVDTDERLISFNRAAADLLDLDQEDAVGQSIQEAVRNTHLQDLVHDILDQQATLETEIILGPNLDERYIHANGTLLRDARSNLIGVLVVLNDVTRLRRLEKVRQEFVANVSHELKTPVTSIKGFVETLLDGDGDNGEQKRFLKIIARQADRLNAIIDDLLTLSRIEQMVDSRHISLSEHPLCEVISDAVEACEVKAVQKPVTVSIDCPDRMTAPVNAPLLEQALINLVDNAIKYSDSNTEVKIVARREAGDAVISVIDTGCGIESEHLPRLFERFYRVEKARSREMGGTGLGLAIVKHIMRAHRGNVTVESTLGSGSTFNLHIPLEVSQATPV